MKKYICDRCGKDAENANYEEEREGITEKIYISIFEKQGEDTLEIIVGVDINGYRDLCKVCFKEVVSAAAQTFLNAPLVRQNLDNLKKMTSIKKMESNSRGQEKIR